MNHINDCKPGHRYLVTYDAVCRAQLTFKHCEVKTTDDPPTLCKQSTHNPMVSSDVLNTWITKTKTSARPKPRLKFKTMTTGY